MYGLVDYRSLEENNRLEAFKHYVSSWKRQNEDTVTFDGEIYSYTTKRGAVKKFKASRSASDIKVNGFYFQEIKD